ATGPVVEGAIEFTDPMYAAICKVDSAKAETMAQVRKRVQEFSFKVDESPSEISEVYFRWKGYGTPAAPSAYVWNFSSMSWEAAGAGGTAEGIIEKSYSSGISNYFDGNGRFYLALISSSDMNIYGDKNQIDTDYVRLRVTLSG
ncbi:MAG: hypothetical protein PHH26_08925, partial [Candidatus Thermoplasmatota archaeon]|nr:hypothetical protein [Candidatus Thermoplasmatota archaeon]